MSQTEVTKIVLNIGRKEIELSPKDVRELYVALKELVCELHVQQPIYYPPIYVQPYIHWKTCGGTVVIWTNSFTT